MKPKHVLKAENGKEKFPLSFNQEQLWFFNQMNPESAVYTIPGAIIIRGELDIGVFESSINELIKRHDILRATFYEDAGVPFQEIVGERSVELETIDLSHIENTSTRQSFVFDMAKAEAQQPFDLLNGTPFRMKLYQIETNKFLFQFIIHHMISDGWSMNQLMEELLALYEIQVTHNYRELNEVDTQYQTYANWQKQCFDQGLFDHQLAYWKKELASAPELLQLPLDKARPIWQTFEGNMVRQLLSSELNDQLRMFAKNENVSLFQVVLTAFQVLLYRYTHQPDYVLGFLNANRGPETQYAIGYYVNALPLRVEIDDRRAFRDLLKQTTMKFSEALANSDIPFIKIVDQLKIKRNSNFNPLFQVLVASEKNRTVRSDDLDLTFEYTLVDDEKSKFDLTLFFNETDAYLEFAIEYNNHLFFSATIERMLANFIVLLGSIMEKPNSAIGRLAILSENEKNTLLHEWNDTRVDYSRNGQIEQTLHARFETQVYRSPEATAVIYPINSSNCKTLSYRALNARANQLARYLQAKGARKGTLIGIFMERSIEMVIGLLGILKSGAAYVPIEPEYPDKRIDFMIDDSQVSILLVQSKLQTRISHFQKQIICMDGELPELNGYSDANMYARTATESDFAYMIYTSGSTGKPKGALNRHLGICNRLLWMQDAFNLNANDRVLQKTPFSFDVSVWEFFWPLLNGGTLIMARPGGHRDTSYLLKTIVEQKITTLHFVPSMLRLFLEQEHVEKCEHYLKRVICSGEELTISLSQRFFECLNTRLFNLYGPTEAAIDVTWWECKKNPGLNKVPIGKPIANTQIYILDAYQQLTPIGVPGELYIGGLNVGAGYHNRPKLNAEKFIPHPWFKKNEGFGTADQKLYRTGDQARHLPDGNIVFLGRLDKQVKVHGYRIEAGEIESIIMRYPGIRDVVVTSRTDSVGMNYLVAYVQVHSIQLSSGKLKKFIRMKLPKYMVPAFIIPVDKIPLTQNGKIDLNALPAPSRDSLDTETRFMAPKTQIEKALAPIWSSVLELDQIGIHDNFFDIGGDSIRSLQVLSKAEAEGLKFSLQDIFQYQTIYELSAIAKKITQPADADKTREPFVLVTPEDHKKLPEGLSDAYPLSMLQKGLVFHSHHSADYAIYITSFHLAGQFNHALWQAAIHKCMRRHAMLRTSFDLGRFSEPLQLVHEDLSPVLQIHDLKDLSEAQQNETLADWMNTEKSRKFNWDEAPLFRFVVHLRASRTFQFTIVEPFLDGWSVMLLATEILSHYRKLLNNNSEDISLLSSDFGDYIIQERAVLDTPVVKKFWDDNLVHALKTRLPRQTHEAWKPCLIRSKTIIPVDVVHKIQKLAKSLAVPLKTILFAAHIRVISYICGQTKGVTGFMSNCRPEATDGDKIIGLFLNVLPFCFHIVPQDWKTFILNVFRAETEMIPYRTYPLAQIQQDNYGILFDTVFNFVHFHPYKDFSSKEIKILDVKANDQTYFDLTAQFSIDAFSLVLELSLDYNSKRITESQAKRISQYYLQCLTQVVDRPESNICDTCLLSPAETRLILTEWNQTEKYLPEDSVFHELFEKQVKKAPFRIAASDQNIQMSYTELNRQANKIAHALLEKGVATESIIPFQASRNVIFLAAILGIFKAGCAYLPIHPDWPAYRIRLVLEQCRAKYVIVSDENRMIMQEAQEDLHKKDDRPLILSLDALIKEDAADTNPGVRCDPQNLAYVLFTSGSTGSPKGAMIEQKGMLNHIYSKLEDLQLDESAVIAETASQSFDISVWQFLAALLVGGSVVIAEDKVSQYPLSLARFVTQKQVTVLETVPSMLRVMLAGITAEDVPKSVFSGLKWLLVTGEAFPADLCWRWGSIYPDIPIVNAYGPTECSDDVTHHIIDSSVDGDRTTVPIGRPIRNTKIYILNEHLLPVPIGTPGELYVAGVCVGRGYINDPDQTAKSFLPNSLDRNSSGKLYKTGDLGRFLPDGTIEFFGRIDYQVKIHGLRIELEEIEYVLRQNEAVRDVAVILREKSEKQALIAYIVLSADAQDTDFDISSLRSYLRQKLPEYMVPYVFQPLNALPLNANGKLDRKSLPDPDVISAMPEIPYVKPRNEQEELLKDIWERVLKRKPIGIHHTFYDLGGHSLQAIELVSKMSQALQHEITLKCLFQHPSIAQISNIMLNSKTANDKQASSCHRQQGSKLPLSIADRDPAFSCVQFEHRSLWKLVELEKIEPVDAAALGYLPSYLPERMDSTQSEIISTWFSGFPVVRRIFTTKLGRIAHITLPLFPQDFYNAPQKTLSAVKDGLVLAGRLGARVVSLTGLLPSATDYGRKVKSYIGEHAGSLEITTGHPTTATAVVFAIKKILSVTHRASSKECASVLGMGSIGLASLRLMLRVLPHPAQITLCDIYDKQKLLKQVQKELVSDFHYKGTIRLVASRATVPKEFYRHSTLVIGASSVESILDIQQLNPGTLIVDDSSPHCFDTDAAIERLEKRQDILFTEGGVLKVPESIHELRYMPSRNGNTIFSLIPNYRNSDQEIMGCILSSAITDYYDDIESAVGHIDVNACFNQYQKLSALGYDSVDLCCKEYIISEKNIQKFNLTSVRPEIGNPL